MEITLSNSTGAMEYVGTNAKGQHIHLSGNGSGVGPMESLLMAGAGCSAIDIELILDKMRQDLKKVEVKVKGVRAEDQVPKVFTEIHLHYTLSGDIKEKKAEDAVQKSVEKYCSVLSSLNPDIKISYSHEIKPYL